MTAIVIEELKTRDKEPKRADNENNLKTFFLLMLFMKKFAIKIDTVMPIDSDAL